MSDKVGFSQMATTTFPFSNKLTYSLCHHFTWWVRGRRGRPILEGGRELFRDWPPSIGIFRSRWVPFYQCLCLTQSYWPSFWKKKSSFSPSHLVPKIIWPIFSQTYVIWPFFMHSVTNFSLTFFYLIDTKSFVRVFLINHWETNTTETFEKVKLNCFFTTKYHSRKLSLIIRSTWSH